MRNPEPPPVGLPRTARARFGYILGVLLVAVGLGWQLGWGWGLVAAGVGLIAYMVLLYDVEEPELDDPDEEVRFR